MKDLDHPSLGKLRYEPEEGWWGWIALPRFAEYRSQWMNSAVDSQAEESEPDDLSVEYDEQELDAEFAERKRMLAEGKLAVLIVDGGAGRITQAQESSIRHLLENEPTVIRAICEELSGQLAGIGLEFHEHRTKPGDDTERATTAELDASQTLKTNMSFGDVYIGADVIDGHVSIDFRGSCDWDEEHGFEITVFRNDVVKESTGISPFPCPLPAEVDLAAIPVNKNGLRRAELQIYGRWSGIYEVDEDRNCTGLWRHCMICKYSCWDPSGIELARPVPKWHQCAAVMMPYVAACVFLGTGVLSPVLMLLALVIWPGFFWSSLAVCSATSTLLVFRVFRFHPLIWFGVVQIGLASAGLIAWYCFDAFAGVSLWELFGWFVWGCASLMTLGAFIAGLFIVLGLRREDSRVGLMLASPFLAFAGLVGAALWLTAFDDYSKTHLIWIVPLSIFASLLIGLGLTFLATRRAKLLDT